MMVDDQKHGEVSDIRKHIKENTTIIAGCKQTQIQQQAVIDDLMARLVRARTTVDATKALLDECERNANGGGGIDMAAVAAAE